MSIRLTHTHTHSHKNVKYIRTIAEMTVDKMLIYQMTVEKNGILPLSILSTSPRNLTDGEGSIQLTSLY
jgi:hypothetical protein